MRSLTLLAHDGERYCDYEASKDIILDAISAADRLCLAYMLASEPATLMGVAWR
jgi:hypothetical protein